MSRDRQQAAATATVGLSGIAGAGALRHYGLADAHGELGHDNRPKTPRRRVFAERRLLKTRHGRGKYLLGAGLAALSAPAAAKGTVDLWSGGKRRTFVEEGVSGAAEALRERNTKENRRAPVGLRARNYAVGAAATGATGGATHFLLRKTPIPHAGRASIASVTGALAGLSTLPVQAKVTRRASKGKYTATPTGLKRVVEPVNHGARHGTRVAKVNDAVTGMSRKDELKAIKRKQRTATVNAATGLGGVGSLALLGAAALPGVHNRGRLVRTASTLGTASAGVGAVNSLEGAHLARRDLKARKQVLLADASKGLSPRKSALIHWSGNGWQQMTEGAARHPRRRADWASAQSGRHAHKASGGTIGQFEAIPNGSVYERQHGRVIKALTVPGVLRAPRVRRGFLRQTRSATGISTSTVRGGLIR